MENPAPVGELTPPPPQTRLPTASVAPGNVRASEKRACELGANEVGTSEDRVGEVGAAEIAECEIRGAEVCMNKIECPAVAPGIPASNDSDGRLYVRSRTASCGTSARLVG